VAPQSLSTQPVTPDTEGVISFRPATGKSRRGIKHFLAFALFSSAVVTFQPTAPVRGDEASAKAALKSKGIQVTSSGLSVVVEERNLSTAFGEVGKQKSRLAKASNSLRDLEERAQEAKDAVQALNEQHAALSNELKSTPTTNPVAYNNLVNELNDTSSTIQSIMDSRKGIEKEIDQARKGVSSARDIYVQDILELRAQADRILAKYAELAKDDDAKAALRELSLATSKTYTFEPPPRLKSRLKELEKLENTAVPATVSLRREGGRRFASVVINGKQPPLEMLVDTGCTSMLLPYPMALNCGAKPDGGRDGHATIADGSTVKTKVIKLDSVRVGKFNAQNVECSVLPAELGNVEPLLGMSFLDCFYYELKDSELVLSYKDAGSLQTKKHKTETKRTKRRPIRPPKDPAN
jgi:clan AA aspartic protease (TIGR02281 family)